MKWRLGLPAKASQLMAPRPRPPQAQRGAKLSVPGAIVVALSLALVPSSVTAKLPEPTPEQARAAADKKAQAAAQAEKDKQALVNKMDEVAERWRKRAAEKNWKVHPPTPVKAVAGIDASSGQSGASGQPGGKIGEAAKQLPIRSEKHGTAAPSRDVKQPAVQQPSK